MPSVFVYYPFNRETILQKMNRDLLWYDPETRVTHKFTGGKLEYNYVYDDNSQKYRLMPRVVDVDNKTSQRIPNLKAVDEWFDSLITANIELIDKNEKEGFNEYLVPSDETASFVQSLIDQGFTYMVYNA